MDYLGAAVILGLAFLGAVVEVVRLEGRLNAHDTLFIEREKLAAVQHLELTDWLKRVEEKLDRSLRQNDGPTTR